MKFRLGSLAVVAGSLLSFALVGCDAPMDKPGSIEAPKTAGPGMEPGPVTKPADTPATPPVVEAPKDAPKPVETPAPVVEAPKDAPKPAADPKS